MTFRHLKIMTIVADLGSMTEAAKKLYISQPSVSQAIREIETHYNIKLFERFSKKLYITDSGKQYLNYARHITQLFEEMERSLTHENTLKIGASLTVGEAIMPELISRFKHVMPELKSHVVIKNTSELESLLLNNQIDMALVEGNMYDPHIKMESVCEDELLMVCGKSHPLYERQIHTAEALQTFSFIVREQGSGTRELLERTFLERGLKLNIAWECNGFESIKKAVAEGHGVAAISKRLVEDELKSGILKVIGKDLIQFKRTFNMAYHKNKFITPALLNMMTLIKKWV
ncbi:LysR family transcriptional regulator [Fusibacter ferrireducens]|uniref:LysR family transcriptional regulator n=1 Tax=Fusibacter ferrireducens TaxID=2785058 RepID=A0ABR9ZQD7_9FIRM|nr:LysR family transcriptional regulator [Fusibacter ferrireducens]MBF4692677.1 LysR family transcriptional regulator [Fusibacter ferrireducens]